MTAEQSNKQTRSAAPEAERRKDFLERMEIKLTNKLAARHMRRQLLRMRLQRLQQW